MKDATPLLAIAVLIAVAVMCSGLMGLAGNVITLDGGGFRLDNPQAQAQATRVAVEAEAQEAKLVQERETEQRAQGAAVAGKMLVYFGAGLGALILCVGMAIAFVTWTNRRAASVYPNPTGQYPLIVRTIGGSTIVHDANRAVGPTTIYTAPRLVELVAERLGLALPAPTTDAPLTASEGAHVQVTSQAQASQLVAALTRPQGLLGGAGDQREMAKQLVEQALSPRPSLPPVRIVDDEAEIVDVTHRLECSE